MVIYLRNKTLEHVLLNKYTYEQFVFIRLFNVNIKQTRTYIDKSKRVLMTDIYYVFLENYDSVG